MKKIKYQVSPNEAVGLIPEKATIEAYLLYKGDSNDGLIFIPSLAKYRYEGKVETDKGCSTLMFAQYDANKKLWRNKTDNYINLEHKALSKNKAK
jgi:hypothetical protein